MVEPGDHRLQPPAVTAVDGLRYVASDGPTYQLLRPVETPTFNLAVLLVVALAALSALLLPAAAAWRRLRRRPKPMSARWRAARWLAASAALLGAAFLAALAAVVFTGTGEFLYGVPRSFVPLLAVPVVELLAAVAALACTVAGWRDAGAGVAARVHQLGLLAGLAALAWFLWQWNLLGWQFS